MLAPKPGMLLSTVQVSIHLVLRLQMLSGNRTLKYPTPVGTGKRQRKQTNEREREKQKLE